MVRGTVLKMLTYYMINVWPFLHSIVVDQYLGCGKCHSTALHSFLIWAGKSTIGLTLVNFIIEVFYIKLH